MPPFSDAASGRSDKRRSQDACGEKPPRRVVRVPAVPVRSARRDPVGENRVLHKLGDSFRVTAVGARILAELVLQFRPVSKAVLLCERMLNMAQTGLSGSLGVGTLQTCVRLKVVGAQSLEPAFGFLLESVEIAFRGELSTHENLPSVTLPEVR